MLTFFNFFEKINIKKRLPHTYTRKPFVTAYNTLHAAFPNTTVCNALPIFDIITAC